MKPDPDKFRYGNNKPYTRAALTKKYAELFHESVPLIKQDKWKYNNLQFKDTSVVRMHMRSYDNGKRHMMVYHGYSIDSEYCQIVSMDGEIVMFVGLFSTVTSTPYEQGRFMNHRNEQKSILEVKEKALEVYRNINRLVVKSQRYVEAEFCFGLWGDDATSVIFKIILFDDGDAYFIYSRYTSLSEVYSDYRDFYCEPEKFVFNFLDKINGS